MYLTGRWADRQCGKVQGHRRPGFTSSSVGLFSKKKTSSVGPLATAYQTRPLDALDPSASATASIPFRLRPPPLPPQFRIRPSRAAAAAAATTEELRIVQIYALGDIEDSAGAGPREAHVKQIEHLRDAPAIYDALMEAVTRDLWKVVNLGQVEVARGMDLALGRMAETLATIRGGGGDIGSAVDDLDKYAKEFAKQGLIGTGRTLGAVAQPALEVVRFTRAPLHQGGGLYDLVADRLHDLVDAATGKVQRARELQVNLDPEEVVMVVKSIDNISELAPSSDDDTPPLPEEEAWRIGPVVVITGLDQMREASDMRFALLHRKETRGWRVLGMEKLMQIDRLHSQVECLWGNLTKLRRPDTLLDPETRDTVLNELDKDADSLFKATSKTDALRRDPGTASALCDVTNQVHTVVQLSRVQRFSPSTSPKCGNLLDLRLGLS